MNPQTAAPRLSTAAPVAAGTHRFVLLQIGRLRLMLPQHEIRAVESAADIDPRVPRLPPQQGVGWIKLREHFWPAYCLSEQLCILHQTPQQRRACVLLPVGEGFIGVLCDDARVLMEFEGSLCSLPDAMRLPNSPLTALLRHEGKLACVSNAARLAALIARASDDAANPQPLELD